MAVNNELNQVKTQFWQVFSLLELVQKSFNEDNLATEQSALGGIIELFNNALCRLEEMDLKQ